MKTETVTAPPTFDLIKAGQSPWLDNISRELLNSGKLKSLIHDSGLLGVTSNPSIFEKAIGQPNGGYDQDIKKLLARGKSILEIYDELTISDIRRACDLFLPVFRASNGEHGFVSLEVLPSLAYDEEKTVSEAKRLFKAVARPNVMIKVPATPEGVRAVRRLIGDGVNINITLMFSIKHYQDVVQAYIAGLEAFNTKGGDLRKVHSVASIFVSRIDTLIDKKLDALQKPGQDQNLKGKAAIANSRLIYQEFLKVSSSERFLKLQDQGAWMQKVLWGSTSTKNPNYPDLIYVETLIGRETVNTMPSATLEAFLDHGRVPGQTIMEGIPEARDVVRQLDALNIRMNEVCETLQKEGVKSFSDSFDILMRTLEKKALPKTRPVPAKAVYSIPASVQNHIRQTVAKLERENFHSRFMKADPTIWSHDSADQKTINNRMGWLKAADWSLGKLAELDDFRAEIKRRKIADVVLLGMGGSSLAPEVMDLILRKASQRPRFHVLDTTDPGSILKVEKSISFRSTVFIVASKSGSTIETLSQFQYFYEKASKALKDQAGSRFIAVTDGGSSLEKLAREKEFLKIFINPSDIGGRFSALSFFGLVPAVLLGIDARLLVQRAVQFYELTEKESQLEKNHGIYLGVVLGELGKSGIDKLTFWLSPRVKPFGAWLEQLIAESTGKEGKGIVPVDGEAPAGPEAYRKDRVFVIIKCKGEKANDLALKIKALKKQGFAVIEIEWPDVWTLGAEFLRWEISCVCAGSVLGINPYDEPNVQESKDNTAAILAKLGQNGKLVIPQKQSLSSFLSTIGKKNYLALLTFAERSAKTQSILAEIQKQLRDSLRVPVLVGFGPRYLHSIGQLYKGGSLIGGFIELVAQDKTDLKVPERPYTFGQLKRAQALGDLQAFEKRSLPVMTVDLGKDPVAGLTAFKKKLDSVLSKVRQGDER